MIELSQELVDAETCVQIVWPRPECRPSVRWFRQRQKNREIPFVKIGHLVFFNPAQVRAALFEKHTVQAVG